MARAVADKGRVIEPVRDSTSANRRDLPAALYLVTLEPGTGTVIAEDAVPNPRVPCAWAINLARRSWATRTPAACRVSAKRRR